MKKMMDKRNKMRKKKVKAWQALETHKEKLVGPMHKKIHLKKLCYKQSLNLNR